MQDLIDELQKDEAARQQGGKPKNKKKEEEKLLADYVRGDKRVGEAMKNSSADWAKAAHVPQAKRGRKVDAPVQQKSNASSASILIAPQVRLVDGKIQVDRQAALMHEHQGDEQNTEGMTVREESGQMAYTSATFSKKCRLRRLKWSEAERHMFMVALRMCGTDFSMIEELLRPVMPQITRKFVKQRYCYEDKNSPTQVEWALSNPLPFEKTLNGLIKEK